MGKGAALKVVLPEANISGASGVSHNQDCAGCSSEDEIGRGLDDYSVNCRDFELFEGDIFDDPYSEAHGYGQLYDIPFSAQPSQDAVDCRVCNYRKAALSLAPSGSLAVDALFAPNTSKLAAPTVDLASSVAPPGFHAISSCGDVLGEIPSIPGSMPSLLQGSSSGISPWASPVRTPRSPQPPSLQGSPGFPPWLPSTCTLEFLQPQSPAHQSAACSVKTLTGGNARRQEQQSSSTVLPQPKLRVENRCKIATAFAAPLVDEVVLFCSQAPKRKAEDDVEPDDVNDSGHDDIGALAGGPASAANDIIEGLIAPSLLNIQEVEDTLPSIPTQQETNDGWVVYILPTLWRSLHTPFRIQVSLGLNSMRALSAEAPVTYYGRLNPRVVTTGVSKQPCQGNQQRLIEAAAAVQTRASRKSKGHASRATEADHPESQAASSASNRDLELLEVWLLQRSLDATKSGELIDGHHLTGTQCTSATITGRHGPLWERGQWAVDIIAKVAVPTGRIFWVKAVNRTVHEIGC